MYVVTPTRIPCKISTQEWEARESGVQGYSRPYNLNEVRLRCMRPCVQTNKENQKDCTSSSGFFAVIWEGWLMNEITKKAK